MNNALTILTKIESSLQEAHISYDALTHLEWIEQRKNGKTFSMPEHIRAMIYAMLSNNRRWEEIDQHISAIDELFFHYNASRILSAPPEYFIHELLQMKCGNRNIRKQMAALHDNIRKLEKIDSEFGSIDHFVISGTPAEIADLLSNSLKYKLQTLGFALAMEYLRNVGIDTAKPDTLVRRILGRNRLGYSQQELAGEIEAIKIIDAISAETGYSPSKIDAILWLFCSSGNGMICTEPPRCGRCPLSAGLCRRNIPR